MTALITLQNVTLGYERHPAVHHLTGVIAGDAMLAVVGPNGAGKSTLLKALAGLIKPLAGTIASSVPRGQIAYLPQTPEIDRSFPISVYDLIAMGRWRKVGLFGGIDRHGREAVHAAIAAVGLTGFETRQIGTLSGGQMQRALFARAALQDARVILFDEPFTGVDERTAGDLLAIIRRWHGEGRAVVAALHDLSLIRVNFAETLLLAREPVAWGATADVLTAERLAAAQRMCEAFDEEAAACEVAAA
jgi:zinc/manganese transport system ATP-binding protein